MDRQNLQLVMLRDALHEPFALGYVFGVSAFAIETHSGDRHSPEATSLIVTLLQIVLRGGTFDECVRFSNEARHHEEYGLGMECAARDSEGVTKLHDYPKTLISWLAQRLEIQVE
jgi:hypothetical protein